MGHFPGPIDSELGGVGGEDSIHHAGPQGGGTWEQTECTGAVRGWLCCDRRVE